MHLKVSSVKKAAVFPGEDGLIVFPWNGEMILYGLPLEFHNDYQLLKHFRAIFELLMNSSTVLWNFIIFWKSPIKICMHF